MTYTCGCKKAKEEAPVEPEPVESEEGNAGPE